MCKSSQNGAIAAWAGVVVKSVLTPLVLPATESQQSVAADKHCGVLHPVEREGEADGDRHAGVVLVRQAGDDCPGGADVLEREARPMTAVASIWPSTAPRCALACGVLTVMNELSMFSAVFALTVCKTSWTAGTAPLVAENITCAAVPANVVIAPPREIVDPIAAFSAATAAALSVIATVVVVVGRRHDPRSVDRPGPEIAVDADACRVARETVGVEGGGRRGDVEQGIGLRRIRANVAGGRVEQPQFGPGDGRRRCGQGEGGVIPERSGGGLLPDDVVIVRRGVRAIRHGSTRSPLHRGFAQCWSNYCWWPRRGFPLSPGPN